MSYWKYKKTTPVEWLTKEVSHYIQTNKENFNQDEFFKSLMFWCEECKEFEKDYSVEFLNWVTENHYKGYNQIRIGQDWTFTWKSESDENIEYTSQELFDKFKKR